MVKIKFNDFKTAMKRYYKEVVDKEEGETFTSWFTALMDAMKSEGKVITEGKEIFIIEE